MIPESRITKAFIALAGEEKLISLAKSNVMDTLDSIQSIGPAAYIASNGRRTDGSASVESERQYWWSDTEVDVNYLKDLVTQEKLDLEGMEQSLSEHKTFEKFAQHVFWASDEKIDVEPKVELAQVNVGREQKQVLRFGFVATADSTETFEEGVKNLYLAQEPENEVDYASMILPQDDGCGKLTFKD